ncbi:hypothetical protein ACTFIR_001381 [Dictyostelium discoideum]
MTSEEPKEFQDKFGTVGKSYKTFRPTYTEELYSIIDSYCDSKRDLAIDCGCGSGQATVKLAKYFKKVIGFEPSQGQIENAVKTENVDFRLSPAEKIELPSGSVDLITVATAVHWFDLPVFYQEAKRLLRDNGSLILFTTGFIQILNNDEAQKINDNFRSGTLGDYWAPIVKYVIDGYVDIKPPFENVERKTISLPKLMSVNDVIGIYSSWSGYASFIKAGNNDVLPEVKQNLMNAFKTTDPNAEIVETNFPVYMVLSKK